MLDVTTREELAVLVGHTGTIAALDADAAGRMLISGSFDTTARVWNIDQIVAGKTTAQNAPNAPLQPPIAPPVAAPVTQAAPLTLPTNTNPHTTTKPGVVPSTPTPSIYK
jgi:WD40 repeat protein